MRGIVIGILLAGGVAAAEPPAALVDAAKAQVGTYRCKGTVADDDAAGGKRAVAATLTITADLDGQWLVWRLAQTKPVPRGKRPMQYVIHRRVDADGTWHAVQVDSTGGRAELTAKDGATWDGTLVAGAVTVAIRDHQEVAGRTIHLWGEYELEPGTFDAGYDVTCKR
jgi:hypothetical protein